MPKITFVNEKKEIDVPTGANLRDEAKKAGITMHPSFPPFNCMGHGMCGTCKVIVKSGKENLSQKGFMEKVSFALLHPFANIGHEDDMRLSCQCAVNGDVQVETTPAMNLSGETFWQKPFPNK
jgi:ferredoxin